MKIGIFLDPYGEKNPSGLGRWAREIVEHLTLEKGEDSYITYVKKYDPNSSDPLAEPAHITSLDIRSLWFSAGPHVAKDLDLYVFLTSVMPLTFFPKRSIVVALDFAYLELPSRGLMTQVRKWALYTLHAISFAKATRIICISEQTRASLRAHFGVPLRKTDVVTLGPVGLGQESESVEVESPYFLFAGVLKERKNVRRIIEAFGIFLRTNPQSQNFHLYITGKTAGAYYESLVGLVKKLGIESNVRFLGYVLNSQLLYLYQHATALVFPSLIEGFGMPVLEAMQVGLPVITAHQGALAEVAGDAALLVDPYSPESIAGAMTRIAQEPDLPEELRERGHARAVLYSWDATARQFEQVIEKCK